MMQRLIWKDAMTVRPLLVAILIGMAGLFATVMLSSAAFDRGDLPDVLVSIWILMPNLVALGAPAFLVGGEEESGTLAWLRTLPVKWQRIADSKFGVAVVALAIAWVGSSLLLVVTRAMVPEVSTVYSGELTSWTGIAQLGFHSLMLLSCGFIAAYSFRSPVAGLFAVVPLIGLVSYCAMSVGSLIHSGNFQLRFSQRPVDPSTYVMIGLAGLFALGVAWLIQRRLACHRLTEAHGQSLKTMMESQATPAYRPPVMVGTRRPSQLGALLWQQMRQMGGFGIALTVISAVSILVYYWHDSLFGRARGNHEVFRFFVAITSIIFPFGAVWLGGLSFYGDNVRQRRKFFSDRGISPGKVWWTRVMIPGALCLLLTVIASYAAHFSSTTSSMRGYVVVSLLVGGFAVGQLVGQWMSRPILTFFAGPTIAGIMALGFGSFFSIYPSFGWTAVLAVPVLLFASWRLCRRWLADRVDYKYHIRVIAFMMVAILIPVGVVVGTRIATTPRLMPEWRARTLAMPLPELKLDADGMPEGYPGVSLRAFGSFAPSSITEFVRLDHAEKVATLQAELESEAIGEIVELNDLFIITSRLRFAEYDSAESDRELWQLAIAIMLKWARQFREEVVDGGGEIVHQRPRWWSLMAAEYVEERALVSLNNLHASYGATPEFHDLVNQIPDSKLRQQSRRVGLLREWKRYATHGWWIQRPGSEGVYTKSFMSSTVARGLILLPYERTRADRYVDQLAKLLLEQLQEGLPETENSPGFSERVRLMHETRRGIRWPQTPFGTISTQTWTKVYENRIDVLRMLAATQNGD